MMCLQMDAHLQKQVCEDSNPYPPFQSPLVPGSSLMNLRGMLYKGRECVHMCARTHAHPSHIKRYDPEVVNRPLATYFHTHLWHFQFHTYFRNF